MEKYGKKGKFCQIQKNMEFCQNTELLHPYSMTDLLYDDIYNNRCLNLLMTLSMNLTSPTGREENIILWWIT